jgi:hypothetical protein
MKFFVFFTSKSDQKAETPDWLKKWVVKTFGKYFDPCPANPKFDGLSVPWKTLNYVNPPFDNIGAWMDKAATEMHNGKTSILLIPYRAHTDYFKRNVSDIQCSFILNETIAFKGYTTKLNVALQICVFSLTRIPKTIKSSEKQCMSYVSEVDSLKDLVKEAKKLCPVISVLGSSISGPLEKIMEKHRGLSKYGVVCPSRLENKVLYGAFLTAKTLIFANVFVNSKRDAKFPTCVILFGNVPTPQYKLKNQLYSLDVRRMKNMK